MRTKILLTAAAALAAGVVSTQAQVYSQNIVGYVNVTVPGGAYSLISNPLNLDGTNNANSVLPSFMLAQGADNQYDDFNVLTFANGSYQAYTYDQDNGWQNFQQTASVTPPNLSPGTGFFFYNPGNTTNITFVGSVMPAPGSTNLLALTSGAYQLVGSPLPVGGGIAPTNTALNFPLQDLGNTIVLTFANGSYQGYTYDTTVNATTGWADFSDSTSVATPTLNVGQGFFYYQSGVATNWAQTISF